MNAMTLTDGAPLEVPLSPLRFYLAGTDGVETVLDMLDGEGTPLPAHRWVRDSASWILDPIGLDVASLRVVARSVDGATYPARTTLQCTVVVGGQQYLGVFDDLAGRASRDLILVEAHSGTLRLRRAPRHTAPVGAGGEGAGPVRREVVRVLVDGSASMRAGRTAPHLVKVVGAVQDLMGSGREAGDTSLSWHVVRDGAAHPVPGADPAAEVQQVPVSVGSVFEDQLFAAQAHHVVVTDETPEGVGRWTAPEDGTIQVLVVGSVADRPRRSQVNGITVYEDDAGPDSTALIAELAAGFGWDK